LGDAPARDVASSGIVVKSVIVSVLAASVFLAASPAPAMAQDPLTARELVDVCLPYAQRSQSFEKAIRAARNLEFRRPVNDQTPLDEWASEVELVSKDGTWRLRIEEGTVELGEDIQAYGSGCSLSSTRASARQLADLGRRAFGDEHYWTNDGDAARNWSRRTSRPDEYRLEARVTEEPGQRPALTVQGLYF
jgi:hypothetical protein